MPLSAAHYPGIYCPQVSKLQLGKSRSRTWEAVKEAIRNGASPAQAVAAVQAAEAAAAAVAQQETRRVSPATDAEMPDAATSPEAKRDPSPAAAAAAVEGQQPAAAVAVAAADVAMTDVSAVLDTPQQAKQQPAAAAADLAQEEADTAAALLGLGSEEPPAAVLDPAAAAAAPIGVEHHMLGPTAAEAAAADGTPFQQQQQQEPEYFVKWSGKAHIHNEWLRESQLLGIARRKLLNFKKRHGDVPVNFMEDEWLQPERFIARRPSPSNPGWEVLVKWKGQVGVTELL